MTWAVANGVIVEGFLIGLNDPAPTLKITETARDFRFDTEGEQTITVIPLAEGGKRGEPLVRKLIFQPNRPPQLTAAVNRVRLKPGEAVELTASAGDPDGDRVTLESRMDGAPWSPLPGGTERLEGLTPGSHLLEVRASDSAGMVSGIWAQELTVEHEQLDLEATITLYTGAGGRVDQAQMRDQLLRNVESGSPVAKMWLA